MGARCGRQGEVRENDAILDITFAVTEGCGESEKPSAEAQGTGRREGELK